MTTDPRFTITISASNNGFEVRGVLRRDPRTGEEDLTAGPAQVTVDRVQRETVDLLEQWLKRWEWIARFETDERNVHRRRLLVPDTFRILGSLLWRLILANDVGTKLHAHRRAAQDAETTLRVLVCFHNSATDLAFLPWEFLYRPDEPGAPGYFLGTETNLVLSRYMQLPEGRSTMRATKDKLRIVLWLTLPDTYAYRDDRKAFLEGLDALRERLDLVATIPDAIDGWRPGEVIEQLGTKADIVHVVGIYRRVDGQFKIMLPDGSFQDSRILVNSLCASATNRPELVVLHLCDWPESDTTENFERLAPQLVEKGVPAVLAMQYPMQPGDARAFLTSFYDELVKSNDVGKAVQAARNTSYLSGEQRRFGAPVLYLQSAEGKLLGGGHEALGSGGEVTAVASLTLHPAAPETLARPHPARPAPRHRDGGIRQELLDLVEVEAPDTASADETIEWIDEQSWPADPAVAVLIVQNYARDHSDDARLRPMFAAMLRLLRGAAA